MCRCSCKGFSSRPDVPFNERDTNRRLLCALCAAHARFQLRVMSGTRSLCGISAAFVCAGYERELYGHPEGSGSSEETARAVWAGVARSFYVQFDESTTGFNLHSRHAIVTPICHPACRLCWPQLAVSHLSVMSAWNPVTSPVYSTNTRITRGITRLQKEQSARGITCCCRVSTRASTDLPHTELPPRSLPPPSTHDSRQSSI